MVRAVLAAVLAAIPSIAAAAAVDWRGAGGPLFPDAAGAIGAAGAVWDAESVGASSAAGPAEPAPRLPTLDQPFGAEVAAAAARHGVDPKLLHALVVVESAYRSDAVSRAGAAGLAQLMPGTAAELGVRDRFDPAENLSGAATFLARQLLRFQDLRLALAAYNAGPARVARLGQVPNIPETRAYVGAVIDCYLALAAGRGVTRAGQCRAPEIPHERP